MEGIKKSFWFLFYLCATNLVFCQFLDSILVPNPILSCASVSTMDPLDDLEMLSDAADILFSLENVKQSKFKKIFFQVINEQKKLEKVKSTVKFAHILYQTLIL